MRTSIVAFVLSLLALSAPARAAFVDVDLPGGPGGGTIPRPTPKPSVKPTPTPPKSGRVDPKPKKCVPPTERAVSCAVGEKRVDEIGTRFFNTTLMRGCGRFIMHHAGGNAEIEGEPFVGTFIDPFGERQRHQSPVGPELPGNDSGQLDNPLTPSGPRIEREGVNGQAWVLGLVGCGLDSISRIEVGGGGVTSARVSFDDIDRWLVPLSPTPSSSTRGGPTLSLPGLGGKSAPVQKALYRFDATADAKAANDRTIEIVFNDGSKQKLKQTTLMVARNGSGRISSPTTTRWEEMTRVRFSGSRIGNAALAGPACVEEARVASNSETRLEIDARMYCPRNVIDPETGEVTVVNKPSCKCTPIAYDDLLSIYFELDKGTFAYLESGIALTANVDYLASKPGLIGDSLSHGFYGGALKPSTQLWAYPHLVVAQMGGEGMSQNLVRLGPGLEDAIKSFLPDEYGPAPSNIFSTSGIDDDQREVIGVLRAGGGIVLGQTATPTHAGAAGMDYTNVLRTSGSCLDEEETAEDPVAIFPMAEDVAPDPERNVCDCPGNRPEPALEMQLGLACGRKTPIEIMEETKPSFVFASAAGNHFLSCAVHTKARDCIEMERFLRDSSETFRRLRRIPSVRGGVVFGVPPLDKLPWLDEQSVSPAGLRPFYKRNGEAGAASAVLDDDEVEFLTARIEEANAHLEMLAELNGYAYVNATGAFEEIDAGVPIVDPASGEEICEATVKIPTEELDLEDDLLGHNFGDDAGCGIMSLDGIHPNELGHAVITNAVIAGINLEYDLEIPEIDEDEIFATWQRDSLNRDPLDIKAFTHEIVDLGCVASLAIELGALGLLSPVCLGTGQFCAESLGLLGSSVVTGFGCSVEAVLREGFIRPTLDKIVRQPAPMFCWGGPEDRGECRFTNADGTAAP